MRLEFPPFFVKALNKQIIVHGAAAQRNRTATGGKPAAAKLARPVKLLSKRGEFLRWHLVMQYGNSIPATMQAFKITRANVFSYWTAIHREHGIGYKLSKDDFIEPVLPRGCTAESIFI